MDWLANIGCVERKAIQQVIGGARKDQGQIAMSRDEFSFVVSDMEVTQ